MALNEQIAQRIRRELKTQGVSARELARRIEMPQPSLQDRLHGRVEIRPSELESIAAALDVPVTKFLEGTAA